jgi:CBS domain-containing protein
MKIGECCNREVVTAEKDMSIVEVARLMQEHHVGDLIVVENLNGRTRPVGIVTDRDLVIEVLAQMAPIDAIRVSDVMSYEIATVNENDELWETLERMRKLGVRRMPVVDAGGVLVGIITLDDLMELMAEAMGHIASLIRREIGTEARRRS